jgi:hypothetical protein
MKRVKASKKSKVLAKTHVPPGASPHAARKSAPVTDPDIILPSELCAAPRKPRGDAPLQNLPREMQDKIIRHAEKTTYVATAEWLKRKGIDVLDITVKRFRKWYYQRLRREMGEAMAWDQVGQAIANDPDMSEQELAAMGRKAFASLAISTKDAVNWARQQLVRQRELKIDLEKKRVGLLKDRMVHFEGQLKLAREKFEFDAAEACLKKLPALKAISNNASIDSSEKIKQIRLALFGSAPE